jgi:uncharacterized protein (DUF2062 family)
MAKKLIQKYLPHPKIITDNRLIRLLGPRLHDPSLWHINRKSFSGAIAVGVFFRVYAGSVSDAACGFGGNQFAL